MSPGFYCAVQPRERLLPHVATGSSRPIAAARYPWLGRQHCTARPPAISVATRCLVERDLILDSVRAGVGPANAVAVGRGVARLLLRPLHNTGPGLHRFVPTDFELAFQAIETKRVHMAEFESELKAATC